VSDTPRTDAAYSIYELRKVAQDIERELYAMTMERDIESERATHYRDKWQSAEERIKRLEDELNELRSDAAGLLKYNEEIERRINRILDVVDKMFPWSERVGQEFWTAAKEAKP